MKLADHENLQFGTRNWDLSFIQTKFQHVQYERVCWQKQFSLVML